MTAKPDKGSASSGVAHPRETYEFRGHESAVETFARSVASGKLPHAWLLAGPQGTGKATFAYRAARFLLSQDPRLSAGPGMLGTPEMRGDAGFAADPQHPVCRLIESESHPNLLVLKRTWDDKKKRLMTVLSVDEVRRIHAFYGLTANHGTWRITIIDTVDDMNTAAANALLKTLEEPPQHALLLLIAHQLGRVLPTIRSRCRLLKFKPLADHDVQHILQGAINPPKAAEETELVVRLAQGSAGQALRIAELEGVRLYLAILEVVSNCPNFDPKMLSIIHTAVSGPQNEERFHLFFDLLTGFVERTIRSGSKGGGATILAGTSLEAREQRATARLLQLPLERLVDVWERLLQIKADCDSVNLDRKQAVFEAFSSFERRELPNTAWAL